MSKYLVSVDKFIAAPAQELFDVVADPAMHPEIDGSGTVHTAHAAAPERLALGARFGMGMKMGARYSMQNTVTEFEEGRLIAWQPRGGYTWRYRFVPVDGGTLVTEQWDARTAKRRTIMGLLGFPRRNRRGITATLHRLAARHGDASDG